MSRGAREVRGEARRRFLAEVDALPLRRPTRPEWARLAAERLDVFLPDHAFCEQQAALAALNLVAHYPEDADLVERMTALAAEEILHLRRVSTLLRRRDMRPARRRVNPYARDLHTAIAGDPEPWLKVDRLLVGALIEARSCERFTRLLVELGTGDEPLTDLLFDLGPAERRHWQVFWELARAAAPERGAFERRWERWLDREAAIADRLGRGPTVHG